MDIKTRNESLKKYEGMVKAIANEYLAHLNNSILYTMKLAILEVVLTNSEKELTSGVTRRMGSVCQIVIAINEDNGDDYIAFVVAHEFAHLLFQKVTDCLCVTGRAPDGSTDFTAITRISQEGKFYGRELEEQCADILALYIIKYLGYSLDSIVLKTDLRKTELVRGAVEGFINVFGSNLYRCDKIDNYRVNNGFGMVSNSFWYYVVTFSFVEIVKLYDEVMGEGAFERFSNRLDHYGEDQNIDLIMMEVKKFRKIGKAA